MEGGRLPAAAPARTPLFPGFFLGGFECATHIDRSGLRRDYVALTRHDEQVREDYRRARSAGIRCVREGVRWHLCDRGGRFDFGSLAPMVDAAQELGITQIHCLFHYGYPDDLDPLEPAFVPRFRDFGAAFAEWRIGRVEGPRWYVVANEPSLFAYAAGEAGWFAPFLRGKGRELKLALVKATLAATDAIRAVDPEARFLAIDPVYHTVPPRDQPERAGEAERWNRAQFEFWDMLSGRAEPELGGGTGYLDVIGVNYYPDTQTELGSETRLPLDDPRRRPFRELLAEVYARYRRPVIVAETSARGRERPRFLRETVEECLAAMRQGVDLRAICLYPLVDIQEWKFGVLGPFGQLGLWDLVREGETLRRVLHRGYLAELERARRRFAVEWPGLAGEADPAGAAAPGGTAEPSSPARRRTPGDPEPPASTNGRAGAGPGGKAARSGA